MSEGFKTKEELIARIKSWGGKADPEVDNVYWVMGRCVMLIQQDDGTWDLEDL